MRNPLGSQKGWGNAGAVGRGAAPNENIDKPQRVGIFSAGRRLDLLEIVANLTQIFTGNGGEVLKNHQGLAWREGLTMCTRMILTG